MALYPSCVRSSVRPFFRPFVYPCVCFRKLFHENTSQKLLTGFLPNFTGMFLRWSSFKFLQIIVYYGELAHSVPVLENRISLVRSPSRPIFLPRTDDSHCDRIHSCLDPVHCFDNGMWESSQWLVRNIV